MPIGNVLSNKKFEEFRLSHSGLSDDIHVPATVDTFDAEDEFFLFKRGDIIGSPNKRNILRVNFSVNRQLRRRRRVSDYLDLIMPDHIMILTFFALYSYEEIPNSHGS